MELEQIRFSTAGQLKQALKNVPDERLIISQVIAIDGSAWNMYSSFCPLIDQGNIAVITLSHPMLKILSRESGQCSM